MHRGTGSMSFFGNAAAGTAVEGFGSTLKEAALHFAHFGVINRYDQTLTYPLPR